MASVPVSYGSMKETPVIHWYYFTRMLGVVVLVYGLLVDSTAERGTIILGGFGLIGFDKVARNNE